jgi:hypothetical protein
MVSWTKMTLFVCFYCAVLTLSCPVHCVFTLCIPDYCISSGGVSMGDKDLMGGVLASRGTVHFDRVRMKPGKPLTFATLPLSPPTTSTTGAKQLLVFAVPGNPVSAIVTYNLVVLPALRRLAGCVGGEYPHLSRVHARLAKRVKLDPARPEYHRYSYSTHTVLILCSYCAHTVLILYSYCAPTTGARSLGMRRTTASVRPARGGRSVVGF